MINDSFVTINTIYGRGDQRILRQYDRAALLNVTPYFDPFQILVRSPRPMQWILHRRL